MITREEGVCDGDSSLSLHLFQNLVIAGAKFSAAPRGSFSGLRDVVVLGKVGVPVAVVDIRSTVWHVAQVGFLERSIDPAEGLGRKCSPARCSGCSLNGLGELGRGQTH
jgi:hypothetical protein